MNVFVYMIGLISLASPTQSCESNSCMGEYKSQRSFVIAGMNSYMEDEVNNVAVNRHLELPSFPVRNMFFNEWVFGCKNGGIRGKEELNSRGELRIAHELDYLCLVVVKMDRMNWMKFSEPRLANLEQGIGELVARKKSEAVVDELRYILCAHYLAFGRYSEALVHLEKIRRDTLEKTVMKLVLYYGSKNDKQVENLCNSTDSRVRKEAVVNYICAWRQYKNGNDGNAKELFRKAADSPLELRTSVKSDYERLFNEKL